MLGKWSFDDNGDTSLTAFSGSQVRRKDGKLEPGGTSSAGSRPPVGEVDKRWTHRCGADRGSGSAEVRLPRPARQHPRPISPAGEGAY